MAIVADTHVHFYDCYDLDRFLSYSFLHLDRLARKSNFPDIYSRMLCLTERGDCNFFRRLSNDEIALPADHSLEAGPDRAAVRIRKSGGDHITVLAGRQVVTAELLEVLAIGVDIECPDGLSIREVLEAVIRADSVPVLAWAPGKWFFKRGRIVREILEEHGPDRLLVGDSSLRPAGWPEPRLLRYARDRGFNVLAGSDPLPFAGEERHIGTFGVVTEEEMPTTGSTRKWRDLFFTGTFKKIGRRSSPITFFKRMKGNADAKQ